MVFITFIWTVVCQEQVILRTKQNYENIGRILCINFYIVMVRMKAL